MVGIMLALIPNKSECQTIVCKDAIHVKHKQIGLPIIFGNLSANLWIKYKIFPCLVAR